VKLRLSLKTIIAVILVSLSPSAAFAGTFSAVVNGRSYHFNSSYHWNENNFGFGLEHEFTQRNGWRKITMVNGFRDSTNHTSYMAGAGLQRRLYTSDQLAGFSVYAGLNAFLMTREDVNGNKPFPGILPSVTIANDRYGLNLTYLPKKAVELTTNANIVDPTLSGILFVQFTFSLDQVLP
jgi:hypothetical protein